MKFVRIVVLFVFCLGLATEAFAAKKGGKRDIISVRTQQHAQKQTQSKPKPKAKPKTKKKKSAPKKKGNKPKPKKEKKKEDKKKKDDKKDKESSGGGGGGKGSSKDESLDGKEGKGGQETKPEAKSKKEGKKASERQAPERYFLPDPRDQVQHVALTSAEDRALDQLVQQDLVKEAKEFYQRSPATPRVDEIAGVEHLELRGLSKGAAAIQLMRHLETKKEKTPTVLYADEETKEYLNRFVNKHVDNVWVTHEGDKMEIFHKGSAVGFAGKYPAGKSHAKDSLEQLICLRAFNGEKVAIQFKVVKDQRNKPVIQAHFKNEADAKRLAAFLDSEMLSDVKSSSYYVSLKEGKSKMILPAEGGSDQYYLAMAKSLERNQNYI